MIRLRRISPDELPIARRDLIDDAKLAVARSIVDDVRTRGERALREYAARFDGRSATAPLVIDRTELRSALEAIDRGTRELLERTADRIRRFALSQRGAFADMQCAVPGGRAGHDLAPVERAGCYAPGGRYPLVSSVLMTAVTARVAGVADVWVATPQPVPAMLAAAAIADADAMLIAGGAQAIAALAFGVAGVAPACHAIVGPGNAYVTAAKHIVSSVVRIDAPAGPSELLILADASADPDLIAADLIAQAEHDVDARPMLVTNDASLADQVDAAIERQLIDLPTHAIAVDALQHGFVVIVESIDEAISISDAIAAEHVQVLMRDARAVARRLKHYGALFIGERTAQVFGDYGIGPNHVLPTSGAARSFGGLSVINFLRARTWVELEATGTELERWSIATDSAALARLEGLEAHARAAERRER